MALGIRPIAANPIASLPSAATTPPATVDFGWFTGLSSRNITKTLTVAVIASGLIAPIAPPVAPAAAGSWFTPLSEPVRTKNFPTSQQAALFFVAPSGEVVTADKWFAQFRNPVRRVAAATRYEQLSVDTDPVVTFSWFGQLRDPMRRVPTWPRHEQTITDTDPIVSFGWFGNFSDPVRRKATATRYEQPSWSLFQAEVRDIGWFSPLSTPTLPKSRMAALSTRYQFINANYRMAWYQDLSKPLFRTRWTPTDQQSYPFFPQPNVVNIGWFNWLSEPKKLPAKFVAADHEFENAFTALAFSVDWYQPLSAPYPAKRRAPGIGVKYPFVAEVYRLNWYADLSRPTLRARWTPTDQQAYPFFPQPNTQVDFGWFKGLQDPVRRLTRPIPDQYIGYPPITASFSWFGELRDPMRRIKPTPTDQQFYPYFPQPNAETPFGWFNNLSDPSRRIREIPGLKVRYPFVAGHPQIGWFNALSVPPRLSKPEIGPAIRVRYQFISSVQRSSWFRPLSEPTRRITSYDLLRDYADWVAVSTHIGWFSGLSDPTRRRPVATRYEQQTWSIPVDPTAVFTGWYSALRDPTRSILLRHSDQVEPPLVTVSFSWFKDLSEPVRKKPRTVWFDEQSFQFPFVPFSYFRGFAEPTPPKRRNPFFQPYTFTPTPPIIPSFGWYGSLSLPVRIKPKVWEGQYQAWEPKTINFEHLGYMAATEQHDFFLAVLRAFNLPLRAYVDIIEKDPKFRGNMGIIAPVPEDSIITSIVTPETIPATGVPVAAVRARVAIIVS